MVTGSASAGYGSAGAAGKRRFAEPAPSGRSEFQRDRDRIVHSAAFRKLQYKTQVFVYHEGDYFRTRLTHSLEVAQIARSLGRSLGLDEDLAEAIALAHDLGHTPFGHAGEEALSAMLDPAVRFDHNDQTLRVVTLLERRYAAFDGLNLTWATIEGIVKHNGPVGRSGAALPETTARIAADLGIDLATFASAEAQVAAVADDIAYNNHDVDDGLRAGLFSLDALREVPLIDELLREIADAHRGLEPGRLHHELVRRMIGRMIGDVLAESRDRIRRASPATPDDVRRMSAGAIGFSEGMAAQDRRLKSFLKARMYRHYRVNRMMTKARRVVQELYGLLFAEPECLPDEWAAAAIGAAAPTRSRIVADYIAGMTDRYALKEHAKLFGPMEKI